MAFQIHIYEIRYSAPALAIPPLLTVEITPAPHVLKPESGEVMGTLEKQRFRVRANQRQALSATMRFDWKRANYVENKNYFLQFGYVLL